jgi:hypothetical protein
MGFVTRVPTNSGDKATKGDQMDSFAPRPIGRVRIWLALGSALWLAACGANAPVAYPNPAVPGAASQGNAGAAACRSPAPLTATAIEGPYFKAGSPERSSLLEGDTVGTRLSLSGLVLNTNCQPIPGASLDFWQANADGQYDNTGYGLSGHQLTDGGGRYQLETVVPGLYPGRTQHIHVKVQAPGGPLLTTQLYFPGAEANQSDPEFDPRLVMTVQISGASLLANFNFILNTQ